LKTLQELTIDFEQESNRSISMPLAGLIIWATLAVLSFYLTSEAAVYVLLFATGAIFPIALIIAKIRRENLVSSKNPLAKLMGFGVLMVNLLWALHIPLLLHVPEYVILSLGIGLGLHWILYSWIVGHWLGVFHAVFRSLGIVFVWFVFPESRLLAVATVIVFTYIVSIYQMLSRTIIIEQR